MTRKVDKGRSSGYDRIERKQNKMHPPHKQRDSKRKLSIYDEFDEDFDVNPNDQYLLEQDLE